MVGSVPLWGKIILVRQNECGQKTEQQLYSQTCEDKEKDS